MSLFLLLENFFFFFFQILLLTHVLILQEDYSAYKGFTPHLDFNVLLFYKTELKLM